MTALRLWHGGIPDLKPGDLIEPGYDRPAHEGCAYCADRAKEKAGGPPGHIDPLAAHPNRVYLTTSREYARHYASLYGRGDLYRVEPVGSLARSAEDSVESYTADAARVLAVYDRAVLLSWSQRRALNRLWATADRQAKP